MRSRGRFSIAFSLSLCWGMMVACLRAGAADYPNPAIYRQVNIRSVPLNEEQRRLLEKYSLEARESVYPDGTNGIQFVLGEPAGQLGRMQKVPLVLFLHGLGEHGPDLTRLFKQSAIFRLAGEKFQKKHPCWFIAPQCVGKKERFDSYDMQGKDTTPGTTPSASRAYGTGCSPRTGIVPRQRASTPRSWPG